MKAILGGLLVLGLALSLAALPPAPAWRMKADYVEACSCHLFCPCYFNKHAEMPPRSGNSFMGTGSGIGKRLSPSVYLSDGSRSVVTAPLLRTYPGPGSSRPRFNTL